MYLLKNNAPKPCFTLSNVELRALVTDWTQIFLADDARPWYGMMKFEPISKLRTSLRADQMVVRRWFSSQSFEVRWGGPFDTRDWSLHQPHPPIQATVHEWRFSLHDLDPSKFTMPVDEPHFQVLYECYRQSPMEGE